MGRKRFSPTQAVNNLELELTFAHHDEWIDINHFWRSKDGKLIIVGYLTYDQDCQDPLMSCDGNGIIESRNNYGGYRQYVGRDEYDEPILDDQISLLMRLRGESTDGSIDQEVIDAATKLWQEAWDQGKIGTPYAVPLDELHTGGYQEWHDRGSIDAVWIPDSALLEHINSFEEKDRRAEARKCFEQALEEYNKWAEGDCYGVIVDVFRREDKDAPYVRDGKHHEATWGFIGREYAEEELESMFNYTKKHLTKKGTPCNSTLPSQSSVPSQTA